MISEVPGLSISSKKKRQISKQADHSSTLPPVYERIKAQLERRKKRQERQERVRQPEVVDDMGVDNREVVVVRQLGGGNNDGQGSRGVDSRGNDRDYEKRKASVKRALKKHRKAEKDARNRQWMEELEEADMDLQWAIDNCFNDSGWEEEEERGKEISHENEDVAVVYGSGGQEVEREREIPQYRQEESGSRAGGSAQRQKVSSQSGVYEERVETSQRSHAQLGSQVGRSGSAEPLKVSSQRQVFQQRLEFLASQKRSQKEQDSSDSETDSKDDENVEEAQLEVASSVTESESEEDVPMPPAQQSLGKNKVS